jgi:N-acetylglucosaminyldiphosphoundecaprenol N-acetyl-beta-D-mannosaminyltransferase
MFEQESQKTLPNPPQRAPVLGYPIRLGSLEDLVHQAFHAPAQKGGVHVVTLNPEMIMKGEQSSAFGEILKSADFPLPDGAGVIWALKRQGLRQARIPGIEFATALLATLNQTHCPRGVALLGAKPEVMGVLPQALLVRFPNLSLAFARDGFFSPEDAFPIVQEMVSTHPRVVLVALGVPRQEEWIKAFRTHFADDTIFVGVGGSFDVWAGHIQRAPQLMQALNLEWLWRFTLEPWRIQRSLQPLLHYVWKVLTT